MCLVIMRVLQGQPNRRTGVCDSDVFIMSGPATEEVKLCGQNSGQHGAWNVLRRLLCRASFYKAVS